jgi:competence ComEA-like helix-hairpin-helix protein
MGSIRETGCERFDQGSELGAAFLRRLYDVVRATSGPSGASATPAIPRIACRRGKGHLDPRVQQMSFAGWENTITKMAGFGAEGTDDEFSEILDYLVKNFPPVTTVHVNQATAAQLESGLGLSTTEAEAVIEYRKKNGDFKSLDDLKKVPDVDAKKLDAKKDRLAF